MATFKEQMTADLAVFFNTDEFAEAAVYTHHGAAPKSINVIFDRGSATVARDVADYAPQAVCKTGDIETDYMAPGGTNDTLTINGTVYKIIGAQQDIDELTTTLTLSKD